MKKDTSELLNELKDFSNFDDFYKENKEFVAQMPLNEYLEKLIEKKGLNKSDIINNSEMSEVYAYQILSGIKQHPKREKLLSLAFGMKLSLDEVQDMLKKTGYAQLYAKIPFDAIIIYALAKQMNIIETNNLLFEYSQETLG